MNNPFDSTTSNTIDFFMASIPHNVATGQKCLSVTPEKVRVMLPANPAWVGDALNNSLHPGCATALADTTCAGAVMSMMNPIGPLATLDLRMDFLRPATTGLNLICEASCIRLSAHVGFAQGLVFQEGQAEPVATVNANMMLNTINHGFRNSIAPDKNTKSKAMPLPQTIYTQDQPALPDSWSPFTTYLNVRRHSQPDLPYHDADALFRLPFRPDLTGNPMLPAIHGGVIAGFAQTASILHLSITNQLPRENPARAVDFSIDYLRSAKAIDTWARCTTVRQGNRSALVQIVLWQDDEKKPIALARGQCLLPPINRAA